jgi:hypothetical protein
LGCFFLGWVFYWQPWLKDTENWLYEEGEDADRPAYQLRLSDLKGRGEPVKRRKREWEERPIAMNQFGQCLQLAQKVIDSFKVGFLCCVFAQSWIRIQHFKWIRIRLRIRIMSMLEEKPSALKREHPALQKLNSLTFMCGSFFLVDPDLGTPLNPDLEPDPQYWFCHLHIS